MRNRHRRYIGRFAPSPTGTLHFGSLVTAVASYLQARSQGGRWRVRIEDIDPPREVLGASSQIIQQLNNYGFLIDGKVILQSNNFARYRQVLKHWQHLHITYPCSCTRKKLSSQRNKNGPLGIVYPGTCRGRYSSYDPAKNVIRLAYKNGQRIQFYDNTYGIQRMNCEREDGDFIVLRRDHLPSYALASSIDDLIERYSEIVRGADLLEHTFRQIRIHQACSRRTPAFRHIPIIVDKDGRKLSKQNKTSSLPIKAYHLFLIEALSALGQKPPRHLINRPLPTIWGWALQHWNANRIPRKKTIEYFMHT